MGTDEPKKVAAKPRATSKEAAQAKAAKKKAAKVKAKRKDARKAKAADKKAVRAAGGTSPKVSKAQKAADLSDPARRPSLGDLHAAIRTLSVMVDCYERQEPMLDLKNGAVDRENDTVLLEVIELLRNAAERQRHSGATRSAAAQLSQSVAQSVATSIGKRHRGRGAPALRSGILPAGWPESSEPFVREFGMAIWEFQRATGESVDKSLADEALATAQKGVKLARARTTRFGPADVGQRTAADIAGVSISTIKKWAAAQRAAAGERLEPEHGRAPTFYGARFDNADFDQFAQRLCEPFGGNAFIRAAAAEIGVDDVLRLAVRVFDSAAWSLPITPEFYAKREALKALMSALGGDPTDYGARAGEVPAITPGTGSAPGQPEIRGRPADGGGLWRPEDVDKGWRLADVARGAWSTEPMAAEARDLKLVLDLLRAHGHDVSKA